MGHIKVHTNPLGVPELTFIGMGNPKRKHGYRKSKKRKTRSASHRAPSTHGFKKSRKRKSNPARRHHAISRAKSRHGYRKRRNPMVGSVGAWVWKIGYGIGGAVGALSLPQFPFLNTYNTGVIGYFLNGASALGLAMLAKRFKGPEAFNTVLFGGLMATFVRAFFDFTGIKLAQFVSIAPGSVGQLQGDARTGAFLAGVFSSNNFVLPTNTPLAGRRMLPAAAPSAATSAMHGQYLSDRNYLD
jgi:hypothetical protein